MPTSANKVWSQLNPERHHGVLITAEDGQYPLPYDDVLRACKSAQQVQDFVSQISDLCDNLATWLRNHRNIVDQSYLDFESDGVVFVVVGKSQQFDSELQDALSALDLEIAQDQDFSAISMRSVALPYCSEDAVRSFVSLSRALVAKLD